MVNRLKTTLQSRIFEENTGLYNIRGNVTSLVPTDILSGKIVVTLTIEETVKIFEIRSENGYYIVDLPKTFRIQSETNPKNSIQVFGSAFKVYNYADVDGEKVSIGVVSLLRVPDGFELLSNKVFMSVVCSN
jgi:hypothetical protein